MSGCKVRVWSLSGASRLHTMQNRASVLYARSGLPWCCCCCLGAWCNQPRSKRHSCPPPASQDLCYPLLLRRGIAQPYRKTGDANVSWPIPSHRCSRPPARSGSTFQHNIGHRRRRHRFDTNNEQDCSPVVGSDAKQGKDEDAVQPPRGKRRRVNTSAPTTRRTAPKRQARLRCTNSLSLQAQRPPPTQGPKRR